MGTIYNFFFWNEVKKVKSQGLYMNELYFYEA